ncbi:MAG TPA: hypothetical protein VK177_11920 [Flavobacteriales bacterium]|nr:hypothetical protein [Flavobacteriales bacterium]
MKLLLIIATISVLFFSCSEEKTCEKTEHENRLEIELCLKSNWKTDHSGFNNNYTIRDEKLSVEIFGHAMDIDQENSDEPLKQTWGKWFAMSGCAPEKQEGLKIDGVDAWMGNGFYEDKKANKKMCQTLVYLQKNNREYFIQNRCETGEKNAGWDMVKLVSSSIQFDK